MSAVKCNHRMGLSYFPAIRMCSDCVEKEVERLRNELADEACAHRVDSAMYKAEIESLRECLREACECYEADADRVEAHIRGPDPLARWRRVAGLDTANTDSANVRKSTEVNR